MLSSISVLKDHLTRHLKDLSEDVIWKLFTTFNQMNPLFDTVHTNLPDSSHHLSVSFCLERM